MSVKKYLDIVGLEHLLDYLPTFKIKVTCDSEFATETITCTNGTKTYSGECPSTSPYVLTFTVNAPGTWTISGTDSVSGDTYSVEVTVTTLGMVETELHIVTTPEGATVTPTDDIQTWLKCANLEKSYTTLAEVLADQETYETLLADSNACDYMARSTTWALAEGAVPTMTSNTTPSGECGFFGAQSTSYPAYRAFDDNDNTNAALDSGMVGTVTLYYCFTSTISVIKARIRMANYSSYSGLSLVLKYSDDGTTWTSTDATGISIGGAYVDLISSTEYGNHNYWGVALTSTNNSDFSISTLQFYTDADITTSETAMRLLGKYDYACDKLLSNATWAEAIANSDYFESVLDVKVPTMTSNTTPSGEVIYSSVYNSSYPAWKAFDENTSTNWAGSSAVNGYIGYDFGTPIKLAKVYFSHSNHVYASGATTYKIQGYDGSNWVDLSDDYSYPSNTAEDKIYSVVTNASYSKFRLYFTNSGTGDTYDTTELQFYGRIPLQNSYTPLVPTMTSNTTPSGECSANAETTGNYQAWRAFDGNDSTNGWCPEISSAPFTNTWIKYEFPNAVKVDRIRILWKDSNTTANTFKIEGSNDDSTYTEIATNLTIPASSVAGICDITNTNTYKYYKCTMLSNNVTGTTKGLKLQFYAKLDKTIIHSAPLDTIYYKNNGTDIPLCSTDSNGIGELDLSGLEDGTYTLYSSVAKDPSNLSNDYSKAIRITKSQYGETKEIYLMPDTIRTLYWYGFKDSNLESNGFTFSGTKITPTSNANSTTLSITNTTNTLCSINAKNAITGTAKVIGYYTNREGSIWVSSSKAISGATETKVTTTAILYSINLSSQYIALGVMNGSSGYTKSMTVDALWYE